MPNDSETDFYYQLGRIAAARFELDQAIDTRMEGQRELMRNCLRAAVTHIAKAMGYNTRTEMLAELG